MRCSLGSVLRFSRCFSSEDHSDLAGVREEAGRQAVNSPENLRTRPNDPSLEGLGTQGRYLHPDLDISVGRTSRQDLLGVCPGLLDVSLRHTPLGFLNLELDLCWLLWKIYFELVGDTVGDEDGCPGVWGDQPLEGGECQGQGLLVVQIQMRR